MCMHTQGAGKLSHPLRQTNVNVLQFRSCVTVCTVLSSKISSPLAELISMDSVQLLGVWTEQTCDCIHLLGMLQVALCFAFHFWILA